MKKRQQKKSRAMVLCPECWKLPAKRCHLCKHRHVCNLCSYNRGHDNTNSVVCRDCCPNRQLTRSTQKRGSHCANNDDDSDPTAEVVLPRIRGIQIPGLRSAAPPDFVPYCNMMDEGTIVKKRTTNNDGGKR